MSDIDYDVINDTELVALCRQRGFLEAHVGLGREILISILKRELDPDDLPPDPVDAEREAMLRMQEEWPAVYEQLQCSDQDFACWACPAGRVIHCVVNNCDKEIRDRVKGVE
jgi:hypothetical protein